MNILKKLTLIEKRFLKEKEASQVKIKVKHPGILDLPEGGFATMKIASLKTHLDKRIKAIGYAKVIRALNNLDVWNRAKKPALSKKAKNLKKYFKSKYRGE